MTPARQMLLLTLACAAALLSGCGPSMTELDQSAGTGQIDEHAPVKIHLEADIAAPPARVWALLVDAPGWPRWDADISGVSVHQPLTSGTRFDWKAGSTTIHSEVKFYDPERRILWTGRVLTAKAIHGWTLAPAPGGHTHVVTDESMDGPLMATLFPSAKLASADESWLKALKRAAEQP